MIGALLFLAIDQPLPSSPDLGTAAARCRPNETGPAVIIDVQGLKDRAGLLRAELYPDNDQDFLADDNVLVGQHKTFRRVDETLMPAGPARLCLRAPAPGSYALVVLHDRNGDHKFQPFDEGIGFPDNPRLGWSRPHASDARVAVGPSLTTISRHELSPRAARVRTACGHAGEGGGAVKHFVPARPADRVTCRNAIARSSPPPRASAAAEHDLWAVPAGCHCLESLVSFLIWAQRNRGDRP